MFEKAPSIYESFNARTLTTQELCDSFIVSEHFQNLASSNHTIMIGPRGSGKTTLMRMLQVEALEIWNDSSAPKFRNSISFSGVFIPTDRFWKTQFDIIKDKVGSIEEGGRLLESIFVYHTLERMASTIGYRVAQAPRKKNNFKSVVIKKVDEAELVGELAQLWHVSPKICSLRSLEVSVTNKKKEVSDYITSSLDRKTIGHINKPDIVTGGISSILGASTRIVNSYFNECGHKWSFLFDELELAPEEIIQPLVDSMRGGPEDVIFKLSLSPYHKNLEVTKCSDSSMSNQDLSFINLTGNSDKMGLEFSKKLCSNIFKKNNLNDDIESYFEEPKPFSVEDTFRELSEKDLTFKEYLDDQRINIDDIRNYGDKNKGPTVRKIKFVAHLRNYYRKESGLASRKRPPDSYVGFSNLCKAMEYNPRMLIGLINKFISIVKEKKTIPITSQLECLNDTFRSYNALLRTIAISSDDNSYNTIFDLIETIATSFKEEIVGAQFCPEPKGTLTFKKDENIGYLAAVGFALNAGALIIVKNSDEPFHDFKDLRKARCRLSYLFSHRFGLLTTKPREIELVDLLKRSNPRSSVIKVVDLAENNKQIDLL